MMQGLAQTPAHSIASPDRTQEILFGLHWSPLIGSRPGVLARRRAVAMRATHYAHCGNFGVALGVTRLQRGRRGVSTYSAAALFAASHAQGEVAMVMTLTPALHWLVACRDGAVLARTDRMYPARDLAEAALRQLTMQHADWQVVDAATWTAATPLEPSTDPWQTIQPLLQAHAGTSPMREIAWYMRARTWPLARIGIAVALAVPVIWHLSTPVESSSGLAMHEDESVDTHLEPVPDAPWDWARLQAFVQDRWTGANAFTPAVQRLRTLPLGIAGWRLTTARCDWQKDEWACRADYEQDTAGATNAALERAAPKDLDVSFTPMSLAHFSWRARGQPAVRPVLQLPSGPRVDRELVTHLQSAAVAFAYMTLGPVDALDGSPFRLAEGEGDTPIQTVMHITRRSLDVQGPLRSFALLRAIEEDVAWETVELRVVPGAAISVSGSTLQLALKGWIYERTSAR